MASLFPEVVSAITEARREAALARKRAHYAQHSERLRERQRAHYSANRERIKQAMRAYYAAHRQQRAQTMRAYRVAHRERDLETKRAWYRANRAKHRATVLRGRYGISADDYTQLLQKQGNVCEICGRRRQLVIDHDHTTGRVRALLCNGCNTGIGYFGEDTRLLRAAIRYLQQHQPREVATPLPLFA